VPPRLRCAHCADVIGVYEPFAVRGPDGWRTTSVAAEPGIEAGELTCLHLACFDTSGGAGWPADA